jgi:threonine-phosphate decarboxylase
LIRESRFPWTVNTLVQGAAVATLFNEDYIERTRRYISVEREFLKNALNGIYGLCAFESSANFIFVSIDEKTGMNSRRLRDKLAPEGILIRDCGNFEGLDNRYFRVAVKEHAQNVVLIEKLKKVFGEI